MRMEAEVEVMGVGHERRNVGVWPLEAGKAEELGLPWRHSG